MLSFGFDSEFFASELLVNYESSINKEDLLTVWDLNKETINKKLTYSPTHSPLCEFFPYIYLDKLPKQCLPKLKNVTEPLFPKKHCDGYVTTTWYHTV